jgi:protein-S-isoprenylcysteine O-methyltransferase Ste14
VKNYKKWASRKYGLTPRLLVLLPAGVLFVYLIPLALINPVTKLDRLFSFPPLPSGIGANLVGWTLIVLGAGYAFWSIISQIEKAQGTPLPMVPTQTLLVTGPFQYCRNPMTLGTVMLYLGISIVAGSLSSIIVVALFTLLLMLYIKRFEERELADRFGQAYLDYKAATPFIIPCFKVRKYK